MKKTTTKIRYERISGVDHTGRRYRTTLLVSRDDARFVTGRGVDREGETRDELYVIDKCSITKRTELVIDLKYGELVPKGTETKGVW